MERTKKAWVRELIKLMPKVKVEHGKAILKTFQLDKIINESDRVMLTKWLCLTHGMKGACN